METYGWGGDCMIDYFKRKFSMSEHGAKGLIKGSLFNAFYFISLMIPMSLLGLFLYEILPVIIDGEELNFTYSIYVVGVSLSLLISGIFYYYQYTFVFISTYQESEEKRIRLGEKLRKLPLAFFGKKDLSDLTCRLMNDVNDLEQMFSHAIPQLIGSFLSTIIIAVAMFIWNFKMSVALFWVIPVVLLITFLSAEFQKKHEKKHFDSKRIVTDLNQENIDHITDIVSNNRQKEYLELFEKALKNEEKTHIVSEVAMASFVNGGQVFLKLGFATTVLAGSIFFSKGEIDLFTFIMYIVAASRVYDPISASLTNISHVYLIASPLGRMKELENTKELSGSSDIKINNFNIEFENVHFSYENGDEVLKGLNFTAKQGAVTALIGPSGCGKSTATKLAARFYDPQIGRVKIGGIDLKEIAPEHLMSYISMVFQDVNLFDNSIFENIKIGRMNATDEEVYEAARVANCDEFIKRLPNGYDTKIGENGSRLSGGERQRISIARALLKNAPILLLDEATASLDVENESLIQEGLGVLIKGKTVLVIAHRMRTIESCHKIIAISDGKVAESGEPSTLYKNNGLYRRLIDIQKMNLSYQH